MAPRFIFVSWDYFRRLGIADDLTIISHLAGLLARQEGLVPPSSLQYDPLPRSLTSPDINAIQSSLMSLSTAGGIWSAARLLDPFFLFELTQTLPGERYPTPRHIARFMLYSADVRPEHDLADFACGSGGMLAWRRKPPTGRTVGYEISPIWARLAWTNCALRSFPKLEIIPGNALDLLDDQPPDPFDRVVMNPPFGNLPVRIGEQSARSETVFIEKAIGLLKDQGRLCVLVPAGSLFGGGRELGMRQTLIEDHQLDAVVALPKDAFQPFSQIRAYALLVTKQTAPTDHATWFFRIARDGYPAGRSRDLSAQPSRKGSDLPLAEALLTATAAQEQADVQVRWRRYIVDAHTDDEQTLETVESLVVGTTITRVERLELRTKDAQPRLFCFLDIHTRAGTATEVRTINVTSGVFMPVGETRDEWIKAQTGLDKISDAKPAPIYSGSGNAQAVAFTGDWRVLAVRIPRTILQTAQNYQLQPERYITDEDERGPLRPPGTLLADIRRNQRDLAARVDGMLGRIEAPPVSDGALLLPVWEAPELDPLLALLSEEQQEVLKVVRQQTWSNEDATVTAPRHFVAADLEVALPVAIVEQTLELLELVGVIVRVTIPMGDQGRVNAYRLTHHRDQGQKQVAAPVEQE